MNCPIPRFLTELEESKGGGVSHNYLAPSGAGDLSSSLIQDLLAQTELCVTALGIQTPPSPKTYAQLSQIFSNPRIES